MKKFSEIFPSGSSVIESYDFSNFTNEVSPLTYGSAISSTVLDNESGTSLVITTPVTYNLLSADAPFKMAILENSGVVSRTINETQFLSITMPNIDLINTNIYSFAIFIYNNSASSRELVDALSSTSTTPIFGSIILIQIAPHSTIENEFRITGDIFNIENGTVVTGRANFSSAFQDELIQFGSSKLFLGINPSSGLSTLEFGTQSVSWNLSLTDIDPLENFKISFGVIFSDQNIIPSPIIIPFNFSESEGGRSPLLSVSSNLVLPDSAAPFKKYLATNTTPVVYNGKPIVENDLVLFLDPISNIHIIKDDSLNVIDNTLSDKVNLIEDINLFNLSTVTPFLAGTPTGSSNVGDLTYIDGGDGISYILDHTQVAYLTSGSLPITPIDVHDIGVGIGANTTILNTDCTFGYLFLDDTVPLSSDQEITDLVRNPFNTNNSYSGDFIFLSFKLVRSSTVPFNIRAYTKLLSVIHRVNGVLKYEELTLGSFLTQNSFGSPHSVYDYLFNLKNIRIDFTNGNIIFNYNSNSTFNPSLSITAPFNNNFCNTNLKTRLYAVTLASDDSIESPYLVIGTKFNDTYNGKPLRNISKLDLSSLETGRNYKCTGYGYHDIDGDGSYVVLENEDIVKFVHNTSNPIWQPIITKRALSIKEQNSAIQQIVDKNLPQYKTLLNKFLSNKVIHSLVDISDEASYNTPSYFYSNYNNTYTVLLLLSPSISVISPKILIWENGILLEYEIIPGDIFQFIEGSFTDTEYKIKFISTSIVNIPQFSTYRNNLQEKQLLLSGFIIIDSASDRTVYINELTDGIDAQYDLLNDTTKVILTYDYDSVVESTQHSKTQLVFNYEQSGRMIDRQVIAIKPSNSNNVTKYRYIEFEGNFLVPVFDGSAVIIDRVKFNPDLLLHTLNVTYYSILPNSNYIKNPHTRILDLDTASDTNESGLYIPYFNNNETIFITNTEALTDGTILIGGSMPGYSCKLVFKHLILNDLIIKVLDKDPENLLTESYTTITTFNLINPSTELYLWYNPAVGGNIEVI
jgi:hypothetical protein